jgi:hypothetical protein
MVTVTPKVVGAERIDGDQNDIAPLIRAFFLPTAGRDRSGQKNDRYQNFEKSFHNF